MNNKIIYDYIITSTVSITVPKDTDPADIDTLCDVKEKLAIEAMNGDLDIMFKSSRPIENLNQTELSIWTIHGIGTKLTASICQANGVGAQEM